MAPSHSNVALAINPNPEGTPSRKCAFPGCFQLKLFGKSVCFEHRHSIFDDDDAPASESVVTKSTPAPKQPERVNLGALIGQSSNDTRPVADVSYCIKCGKQTLRPEFSLCVACHKASLPKSVAKPELKAPVSEIEDIRELRKAEEELKRVVPAAYECGGASAVKDELCGFAKVSENGAQYTVLVAKRSYTFFSAKKAAELKTLKIAAAKQAEADRIASEKAKVDARKAEQEKPATETAANGEAPKKSKKGKSDGDSNKKDKRGGKSSKGSKK